MIAEPPLDIPPTDDGVVGAEPAVGMRVAAPSDEGPQAIDDQDDNSGQEEGPREFEIKLKEKAG